MSESISTAGHQLGQFEKTGDVNHLEAAIDSAEKLSLFRHGAERIALRQQTVSLWFTILAAIDKYIDPAFNPDHAPPENVTPPSSGAVSYPSSIDPKSIPDPAVRAQYEAALKENRTQAEKYRIQLKLTRLNPRASKDVERFLTSNYSSSAVDQLELEHLLKQAKLSPARQLQLEQLFKKKE